MIITPAAVTALFTSFRGDFQAGMKSADPQWRKIAMEVPSTSKSNTYGWLGKAPTLREWIGDRVINDMAAHAYTIVNKTYESTIGVDRDDIEDAGTPWFLLDTSRAIKPIILQNRRKAALQSMTKMDDEAVFTAKQFRFGADVRREVGFGLWQMAYGSRKDLTADNLWAAVSAMRDFKADGGQKLGVKPTVLVVPTALEKQATRLLEREMDANSSNELKGRLELVVGDYL